MAAVVSTRIARLYALSPRIATAAMPSGLTVDFADVTGGTKPADNADVALPTANSALSTANTAASNATTALATLSDIASDNLLTPVEKPPVIADYAVITGEQAGIDGQATAYSITTEKATYDSAVSALTSYLGGLTTPVAWNNVSGNTTIVGTTFRSNFEDVYTKRQALLNAIYAKAKTIADAAAGTATWSGVTGAGKPADNADVTASHTAAGITGQGDLATLDTVGTSLIDAHAVSNVISSASALGTSYPLWGGYVGSVGTPGFNPDTYCGAAAVLASIDTYSDLRIIWGGNYANTIGVALNQAMKNDLIQFDAANSADLGNMTVTVVTDGGYQCLRFAYGAALPAAVSGTSAADAMLLVPGQPYMYVRRIDGAGGYIYASPNPTAATNCAYLVGNAAGTFPATCATKFYGAPGLGSSMLSFGVPRTVTVPATTGYANPSRSHYSNSIYSTSVLLPVTCTSWPSAVGAGVLSVYDATIDVNVYKR